MLGPRLSEALRAADKRRPKVAEEMAAAATEFDKVLPAHQTTQAIGVRQEELVKVISRLGDIDGTRQLQRRRGYGWSVKPRYSGPELHIAATRVQAAARGYRARKQLRDHSTRILGWCGTVKQPSPLEYLRWLAGGAEGLSAHMVACSGAHPPNPSQFLT
eukprot:SAG31_NODE_14066_length_829_cov_0.993151_2_plen_159_part_01